MRRRAFLAALGGAAALPLAARAQQAIPVIGMVYSGTAGPYANNVAAFREGLKEAGFIEGRDFAIEFRWGDNQLDRLPALVADVVSRRVAVIVANSPVAPLAKAATSTIPIVFSMTNDPIADGLVASYNRPGGNATGVAFFSAGLGSKRLELLRQVVSKASVIGVLTNPEMIATVADRGDVQAAAQKIG
jgi:putative ABC transport system substrate-binding protein